MQHFNEMKTISYFFVYKKSNQIVTQITSHSLCFLCLRRQSKECLLSHLTEMFEGRKIKFCESVCQSGRIKANESHELRWTNERMHVHEQQANMRCIHMAYVCIVYVYLLLLCSLRKYQTCFRKAVMCVVSILEKSHEFHYAHSGFDMFSSPSAVVIHKIDRVV